MNKIIKTFVAAAFAIATAAPMMADEGMWLPVLISQRIQDMQAKGFTLDAEDVYSVNQASLKDAVVLFGGGCTGEVVSDRGLLFTNHHCGYSYIQKHSSVEHDYLKDGFWAMDSSQELPNPGLTVRFLDRMEDVTSIVLKDVTPQMDESEREVAVKKASKYIMDEAVKDGKGLKASVEALYYGNQYFLFVFREFSDVRLVGAPPSSIGKFGGDTDNWMWPRHTGDFSIFRIYADKDNNPADYSADNVPYIPKKSFTISRAGVSEGDFTFVFGCPGSTQEYIHSEGVRYVQEVSDPLRIAIRTQRLDIQKKHMDLSQKVRIQYSSKNASVSNGWKKWQGEVGGLKRNSIIARKQAYEKGLAAWAENTEYKGITEELAALYKEAEPYRKANDLYMETAGACEISNFAGRVHSTLKEGKDVSAIAEAFYKDWYLPIDKESFEAEMREFGSRIPEGMVPAYYTDNMARYGSAAAWADAIYSSSIFASDPGKLTQDDLAKVEADPAYVFYTEFRKWYLESVSPKGREYNQSIFLLNRKYMRAQMAYQPDREFYPDANLTLRIAYGKIQGYEPSDGVYYHPVSTLKGIIDKDNPEIFDYDIPQVLRDRYAEGGHDAQPVCFLATNHTTGGNSGSPVINADGNLIGINFDRVWEGTMSDIAFDPSFCRNISLDVRYLLFTIDKIGGASYLFDEMKFAD